MTRPFTAGLAVARLAELSPARSHRREVGRPMQGYCLITCDQDFSRVTLYVENGQTLTDRSGTGGFYYEGWLVGPAGAVSLGAFNVGPDGHGSATRTVASSQAQLGRAELVRVTVEPFGGTAAGNISVLEGRLIWLDAGTFAAQPLAGPVTAFPASPEGGPGDWASRAAAAGLTATVPPADTVVVAPQPDRPSEGRSGGEPEAGSADAAAADRLGADFPAGLARQFGADSPAGLAYQSGPVSVHYTAAPPGGVVRQPAGSPGGAVFHAGSDSASGAVMQSGSDPASGAALRSGSDSASGAAFQSGSDPAPGAAFQPGVGSAVGVAVDSGADASDQPAAQAAAGDPASLAIPCDGSPSGDPATESGGVAALAGTGSSAGAAVQSGASTDAAAPAAPPQPQPASSRVNPLTVQVQLVQRHPMTPRASGSATLNLRRGSITIHLRGLPSPMALGRDRTTGRPFNAYRVWLVNQRNQVRTPVGYCERAWGENFRFQAEGLPLNRNDTILVTVEDRSAASSTGHASPQVLIGSYEP